MIRLFVVLLLLAWPAIAQRSDTIYQRVFTNATATGTSSQIRNIGQSQHVLVAVFEDSSGSCAPQSMELYIEASHNGTIYVPITARKVILTRFASSIYYGFTTGTGAYPYLRARYPLLATGCILNAYYTGTLQSSAQPQDRMAAASGYQTAVLRTTSTSRTALVLNTGGLAADYRLAVYGVHVHNQAATANTPKILFDTLPCTGGTTASVVELDNMPGNATLVWPTNVVPWAIGGPGSSLCAEATAATAVYYVVIYRLE